MKTVGIKPVNFAVRSPARRVFLCGDFYGKRRLLEMSRAGPQSWQLQLPLRPGTYRYRFYLETDDCVTYLPPQGVPEDDMCGLDAIIFVDHSHVEALCQPTPQTCSSES